MLNEMATGKHVEWDGEKFRDYVNIGTGFVFLGVFHLLKLDRFCMMRKIMQSYGNTCQTCIHSRKKKVPGW